MRRRKESPARRAAAILLSAILIAGMLSNAVPTNVLAKEAADVSADAETQKSGGDVTVPAGQETATESGDESGTKPVEEPGDAPEIKPANPAEGEGAPKPGEEPGAEPPVTGGQDGVSEPAPNDGTGQETSAPGDGAEEETPVPEDGTEEGTVSGNDAVQEPVAAPQTVMMMAEAVPQAELPYKGDGWEIDADGKLTISSDAGMEDWIANGKNKHSSEVTSAGILDGVTRIPGAAFNGCSGMKSITISENVTSIGGWAFNDCSSLTGITIPSKVGEIGNAAFGDCSSLTTVTMRCETPPTVGKDAFYGCKFVTDKSQGIHVPTGAAQAYKTAWTDWAAYIADDTPTPPAEEHKHNDVTFTAWTATDSLPTDAGNYYLTKDVTLSATWNVPSGTTTLCLNGKTISAEGNANNSSQLILIDYTGDIENGRTWNLYDCAGGGQITSGSRCCVGNGATFYMYGGKITGGINYGVENAGAFYMYGGEISGSGNRGTYCDKYGSTITVGGSAVIAGNNRDNVWVGVDSLIEIDEENPLSGSAKIGITTENAPTEGNPINITGENDADYSRYFQSDNPDYVIVNGENNVVQLAVKPQSHTHDYGDWQHDDTQHWKACSCGEETDRAAHNFGDWVTDREATATETGTKHRDCQTCGYSQTEIIPAAGEKYTVTVNSGTGGGDYAAGDTVTIKANAPASGKQFNKWEVNSGTVTLASATSSATTFTMPAEAVTVTATYKNKSGGGHSGGGSDSDDDHSGDSDNADGGDTNNGGGNADGGNNNNGGGDNGSGSSGGNGGAGQPGNTGGTGAGQPKVKQEKEGNIRKEVRVEGEDTLDAAVETPLSELADMVLTKEEKQKAAGGTDIRIVLDVKDASTVVSAADKTLVEKALNGPQAKGYTLGQYLDISLYKVIGDSRNIITETNGKLTVTIDVPDSLKNTDAVKTRTFAVIRVHNGKAELLPDLDSNADTITIKTDRFSTYAVVYKDTAGGKGDGAQSESGKPGVVRVSANSDGKNPGGGKDGEPKTEDRTPLELSATLAMIAGLTYLLLYFADRRHGMTEETKKELVSRMIGWAKQGGRIRKWLALAAIFVLLVYYHSIGKKSCAEWREVYGE